MKQQNQQAKTQKQQEIQQATHLQQQIIQKQKNQIEEIRQELKNMSFESQLIEQALKCTNNLQKAIQYIINVLEAIDQKQIEKNQSFNLVLLVRQDLKMTLGKIAAQCAHATLRAFQQGRQKASFNNQFAVSFISWMQSGKNLQYFYVESQQHLHNILNSLQSQGHYTTFIKDAGRTQVAPGSTTVGAIGPLSSNKSKLFTDKLTPL